MKTPETGWLERSIKSARQSLQYTMTPQDQMATGGTVTLPISEEDQQVLYARMNAHFRVWTGKTLEEYSR